MTRRQPAGVPSGGQFATKTHAEVAIDLHDPAAAPLPMLRDETVQAVRDAIEGLESRPVESFRNTYQAFPTAAYGAALDSLRRMRSEMAGEPPPPLRSGADAALDEFRSRRTFIPDTRPITEMQADAVARLDTIVNRLGAKGVGELGILGVAAAISNAIYHATGKRVRSLPMTPDKVMRTDES